MFFWMQSMNENSLTSALLRPRHSPKPTLLHWQKHSAYRRLKMKQRNGQRNVWLMLVLMLLGLVLLSGCSVTQPIPPSVQPTIPTAPVSQLSPPAQTYSSSAAADIETWRLKLISGSVNR